MDKMLKRLDDVFMKMQNLEIQPTVTNVNILTSCYNNLRAVYNELRDTMTKEAKQNAEDNELRDAMAKEVKQNAEDCAE